MYNIGTEDGSVMLVAWVPTRALAEYWLAYYKKYVGKQYPNGKGFYPDRGYRIIHRM